jgi:hypothetical protein
VRKAQTTLILKTSYLLDIKSILFPMKPLIRSKDMSVRIHCLQKVTDKRQDRRWNLIRTMKTIGTNLLSLEIGEKRHLRHRSSKARLLFHKILNRITLWKAMNSTWKTFLVSIIMSRDLR